MKAESPLTYRPADVLAAFSPVDEHTPSPRFRWLQRCFDAVVGASLAFSATALRILTLEDLPPPSAALAPGQGSTPAAGRTTFAACSSVWQSHDVASELRGISHFALLLPLPEPPLRS